MIGILIVTHGNFGKELLGSAELIVGHQENVKSLGLNHGDDVEELYVEVSNQIKQLDLGNGVLVLTDLFGGSPSNVTAANMKDTHFEGLSGVNLPMLIVAIESRNGTNLEELTRKVCYAGVEGIKDIRSELKTSNASI